MLRKKQLMMDLEERKKYELLYFLQDYDPECLNLVEEIFSLEQRIINSYNRNRDYYDDNWQNQKDGIFD